MTVTRLMSDGLVIESQESLQTKDSATAGVPLTLNPIAGGAVGVDFAHERLRVLVANLAHQVLAEETFELPLDYDVSVAMDLAAKSVLNLIERSGLERDRVLGVGLGVPGPVDQQRGRPTPSSISSNWVDVDVKREFHDRIDLPVLLDNNANLGALAEVMWGAAQGHSDVVYLKVGTGIGAGLILGGKPWRGVAGAGGEIGHMIIDETGPLCRCGNRGCLEVYVGISAQLRLLAPVFGEEVSENQLLSLAAQGDRRCQRLFSDVGRMLGTALASVCNIVNPGLIVLGGELARAFDLVYKSVREAIDVHALHLAANSVEIVAGQLGDRSEALGGAALVFHEGTLPMAYANNHDEVARR